MPTRWTLYDPYLTTTFTFPRNPQSGGQKSYKKAIGEQATAAPNGVLIMFEGLEGARTVSFKGVCLTLAERDDLLTWYHKKYQVQLTDDLGESTWIYISELNFDDRKNTVNHQVRIPYTMNAFELNVS